MSTDFCTAFGLLQDMVFFGAGYYCLAHRKSFARQSIEQQNRLFGFHFNERDRKIAEVVIEEKRGQVLNYKFFLTPADRGVGPTPNRSWRWRAQ